MMSFMSLHHLNPKCQTIIKEKSAQTYFKHHVPKKNITVVLCFQVSLKDGWVEQEAAVCQGVDAAVRGAKVRLNLIE